MREDDMYPRDYRHTNFDDLMKVVEGFHREKVSCNNWIILGLILIVGWVASLFVMQPDPMSLVGLLIVPLLGVIVNQRRSAVKALEDLKQPVYRALEEVKAAEFYSDTMHLMFDTRLIRVYGEDSY